MADLFQEKAFEVIKQAVEAVPGVVSFVNYKAKTRDGLRTNVLSNAIEVQSSDVNYKFKIASKAVSFLVEGGNDTFRSSESR
jgi:hypothetical protein